MASIKNIDGKYRVFIFKMGVRKSKVFDVKAKAVAWATQTEADILAGKTGAVPDKTFGDLLDEYASRVSPTKRGERWEKVRINLVKRDPIAAVKLSQLAAPDFANWRDRRLLSVSAASVRREWNLLSSAINIAVKEWHWLPINSMKDVKRPAAPDSRDRLISEDELVRLAYVFGDDVTTATGRVWQAFQFAIETGMRAGEIVGLTWDRVFLDKCYCSTFGKTQAARRDVALSQRAIEIIRGIGIEAGLVFNLNSAQIDSLFRKAKSKAGIEDLHFHDSRHEAITRLAKKLDVLDLARMVGHRDLRMLSIYYNATAESMANKLN
jgi:integrase